MGSCNVGLEYNCLPASSSFKDYIIFQLCKRVFPAAWLSVCRVPRGRKLPWPLGGCCILLVRHTVLSKQRFVVFCSSPVYMNAEIRFAKFRSPFVWHFKWQLNYFDSGLGLFLTFPMSYIDTFKIITFSYEHLMKNATVWVSCHAYHCNVWTDICTVWEIVRIIGLIIGFVPLGVSKSTDLKWLV